MMSSVTYTPAPSATMPASAIWGPRFCMLVVVSLLAGAVLGMSVSVTILSVAGFLAALSGVRHPTVGLLGVGMLSVLDSLTRVLLMSGGLLRYNTFNYILLVVMVLSIPHMSRIFDIQTKFLLALLVVMFLGLVTSPDIATGTFGLLNLTAAFGFLLYFIRAKGDREVLFWMAAVNGVLSGLGCIVMFSQPAILRVMNPNAWAYMAVTALFSVCLAYPFVKDRQRRFLLLTLAVVNCGWVFLSASRGSMFVAIICAVYLIHETKSASLRLSMALSGVLLAFIIATMFTGMRDYAQRRVDKLFDDRYSMQGRTSGRSKLAEAGFQMFLDYPLGRGTGSFATELGDVEGYKKQAHSGWIKTMVENGALGVIMLLGYIGSFAYVGWKRNEPGCLALGMLATFSLASALFSTEFNAKGLWLLGAGATSVLSYPARSRKRAVIAPMSPINYDVLASRAGSW